MFEQLPTHPKMLQDVTRTLYLQAFLAIGIVDWFVKTYQPQENISNWIAAAAGALIIRFVNPNLPARLSIAGWFVGFTMACLFAKTMMALPWLSFATPEAVWGGVGLLGDLLIQLIGWIMRLGNKVGGNVVDNMEDTVDSTIDKVDRVADIVLKVKDIIPDSVLNLFKKNDP